MKPKISAAQIGQEYTRGVRYKQGIGRHGLMRQNEINERFYVGDQWHGAGCGEDRPLVRQNVIKRIADYKMAVIGAEPLTVTFSAEGVAETPQMRQEIAAWRNGEKADACDRETYVSRVACALSDHFATTAERLKFDDLKQAALLDAYITGTGLLYTYWDDSLETGLFADCACTTPVRGDIVSELLHVDQLILGDPSVETLQNQPYLIITQQRGIADIQQTARRYGGSGWQHIRPDYMCGEEGVPKATVLTRFWKQTDENGTARVWGMQVCGNAVVRPAWCLGIRLYPLADFRWSTRYGCGYGESEIVHLIPNQIAINRMLTAKVWATMMSGMPIMVVNGDVVTQQITNDPGQIIPVYGDSEDVQNAVHYVDPPSFAAQFDSGISNLISDTLSQAGVSGVVLGDVHPDNASAILAVREAALRPMQLQRNRFYSFCEDVARVWAEFWVAMYGSRPLKLQNASGSRYCTFDGAACENLVFSIKVDVSESVIGNQETSLQILSKLLEDKFITAAQFISRLPSGTIPGQRRLLQELLQEEA